MVSVGALDRVVVFYDALSVIVTVVGENNVFNSIQRFSN